MGIELTELLPPASSNAGITPVEQAAFYEGAMRMAQEQFDKEIGSAVRVTGYFGDRHAGRASRKNMARELFQCIKNNLDSATPFVYLSGAQVPAGFGGISITRESGDWDCSQGHGITLGDIPAQIASRISAKNALVSKYRANLPKGAAVWLLLYSRPNVSRSVPVPHGIERWKFQFEFDRVLWFVILGNEVVEIQRAEPG